MADVGCGPGTNYHPALRARGVRVLGIDLSAGVVREAAGGCWAVVRADAQALPLAAGSCDRAMCNHALYHVPDQVRALRELRRVTRPRGRVLLAQRVQEVIDAEGVFRVDTIAGCFVADVGA